MKNTFNTISESILLAAILNGMGLGTAYAQTTKISISPGGEVNARSGNGDIKRKTIGDGNNSAKVETQGDEMIAGCEINGRKSSASAEAIVEQISNLSSNSISFVLTAKVDARGGHYKISPCEFDVSDGFWKKENFVLDAGSAGSMVKNTLELASKSGNKATNFRDQASKLSLDQAAKSDIHSNKKDNLIGKQAIDSLASIGKQLNDTQDTESLAEAKSKAIVKIHFESVRSNIPYYLKILNSKKDNLVKNELFAPDGSPVPLGTNDDQSAVILSSPGEDYLLHSTIVATAKDKGGCCREQIVTSSQFEIILTPAPMIFATRMENFIRGGRMSKGHRNVAVILKDGLPHCSATLIAPKTVITAAHCVYPMMTQDLLRAQKITVAFANVYTEPFFPPIPVDDVNYPTIGKPVDNTTVNDIALLYLQRPLAPSEVRPASLHEGKPNWESIKSESIPLTFVGFGFNYVEGEPNGPGIKREASWTIDDYDNLRIKYANRGKNTCQGDSGGPAFLEDSSRLLLTAVTSNGLNDCTSGVNIRVDTNLQWIRSNIR